MSCVHASYTTIKVGTRALVAHLRGRRYRVGSAAKTGIRPPEGPRFSLVFNSGPRPGPLVAEWRLANKHLPAVAMTGSVIYDFTDPANLLALKIIAACAAKADSVKLERHVPSNPCPMRSPSRAQGMIHDKPNAQLTANGQVFYNLLKHPSKLYDCLRASAS